MSVLPDYMRAGMLAQVESTLTDSVTVERNQPTLNAAGQSVPGWSVVAANVASRWLPRKRTASTESVQAGQSMDKVYARVILKLGTDVREGDHLISGGLTYPVLQVIHKPTDTFWVEVEVIAPALGME